MAASLFDPQGKTQSLPEDDSFSSSSPFTMMKRSSKKESLPSAEELLQELGEVQLHPRLGLSAFQARPLEIHDRIAALPTSGLPYKHNYQLQQQWRVIQLRCQTHPHEAAQLDRRGRSCLHAACAKRPPLPALKAIIQACGGDVCQRDRHGRTPLAIAISSSASLEVIRILLVQSENRAASIEDDFGVLPLHTACAGYSGDRLALIQMMLKAYPEAARQESSRSGTPLFVCLETGMYTYEMIQTLVKAYPDAIMMGGTGWNPLSLAIWRKLSVNIIRLLVDACPAVLLHRNQLGGLPLNLAVEQRCPIDVVQLLCASPRVILDEYHSALHLELECGFARPRVVRLLVEQAPKVATLASLKSGHTPLTLACVEYMKLLPAIVRGDRDVTSIQEIMGIIFRAAHYKRLDDRDPVVHSAVGRLLPLDVIRQVLRWHPEQVAIMDRDGHYPLFLALTGSLQKAKTPIVLELLQSHPEVAALEASTHRSMLSHAAEANSISPDVIRALVQAHPIALVQKDPRHELYPFQIAALPKEENQEKHGLPSRLSWDFAVDEDLMQLSAIMELLRAAPDLVRAHFQD